MPRREDDVTRGPAVPAARALLQAGGFLLAVGATLAVLFTDDAQLLKVAVVAVAWAFVLATVAAGRRAADQVRAAAREADLRRAYEAELEREVAARREYELELENELRRETEDAMRDELHALRVDIAALADLRDEVSRVSSLHSDLTALGGLREEIARVASLRDDVAALTGLRSELGRLAALREDMGQLAALREDMGRLRAELTEQLSSEMLVERIVMRTQASRVPGEAAGVDDPARTLEGAAWRQDAPPRELTGGWPAIRLDEPREAAQHFEQVRTTSWSAPATTAFPAVPPAVRMPAAAPPPRPPVPSRRPVPPHPPVPATLSSPVAGPSTQPPAPARQDTDGPRRRHTDEPLLPPLPGELAPTTQHPAVAPRWAAPERPDTTVPRPGTDDRLARILAENGVSPSSGGRRRRRYREDGESDDVLARVLGR